MRWSYGVTTVPSRKSTTLPGTLQSLSRAGFESPWLFVDGPAYGYHEFGLGTSQHSGNVGTVGNWILAAWQLYLREPSADRYAIFQDDLVTCKNLRRYLELTPYPERGYLNLYTFPHNQPDQLARRVQDGKFTHDYLSPDTRGFYPSCQYGKGAVALVFSRDALLTTLSSSLILSKPQDELRGKVGIDGAICEALKPKGWMEYVHNPSLVQHTGDISSMGNPAHQKAMSFPGEDFDAMELVNVGNRCQISIG